MLSLPCEMDHNEMNVAVHLICLLTIAIIKPMLTNLPEDKYCLHEVAKLPSWQLSCHTPTYDQLTQEEPLNNAARFPCHSIPYPWSFNRLVILVIQGHNIVLLYRWMHGIRLTRSQFVLDDCISYDCINGYHIRPHMQSKRSWYDMIWDTIDFDLIGKNTLGGWIHQSKYFRWNSCMTDFLLLIYSYQPIFLSLRSKNCTTSMLLKKCQKIICCEQNHATYQVLKALMKDKKFSKAHPLWCLISGGFQMWRDNPQSEFTPDLSTSYPAIPLWDSLDHSFAA